MCIRDSDDVVTSLFKFKSDGDEDAYYQAARNLISFSKHRLTDGNIIDVYKRQLLILKRTPLLDMMVLKY